MSGEVERPQAWLSDADATPGDLVALGVRENGKVVKYSWPLDEDGVSIEATPHYRTPAFAAGLLVREEPIYTDVVIRFRFREP